MDATPLLVRIARALANHRLEAVMVGNAAAALQGAPVTTVDFDFVFRKTPRNMAKLKGVAAELEAVIFRPFYPPVDMFRLQNDDVGLQIDFLTAVHGIRSLASLRARSTRLPIAGDRGELLIASLEDIIKSKQAANRPKDVAALPALRETLRVSKGK